MKRHPSLKRPRRLSDTTDAGDQYRSASLEPPRATRRKQIDKLDPAADRQRSAEWDATALDLDELQPRR